MLDIQRIDLPVGYDPEKAKALDTKARKRGEKIDVAKELVSQQYLDLYRIADDMRQPRYQIWQESWDL